MLDGWPIPYDGARALASISFPIDQDFIWIGVVHAAQLFDKPSWSLIQQNI